MSALKGLAKLQGQSWACRELYLKRQRANPAPLVDLKWEVGAKVCMTEEASRGYAMALGIPVTYRNYGDTPQTITPGAPSTRLPIYGIITSISGNLIEADWWHYAGKFDRRRTFPKSALGLSGDAMNTVPTARESHD